MGFTSNDVVRDALWAQLHQLASEAVNAGSDDRRDVYAGRILDVIRVLEARYGRQPILLSIRADYTTDLDEERRLLKEAYSLALDQADRFCAFLSAVSLCEYYLDRGLDVTDAKYWLVRARECQTAADENAALDVLEGKIAARSNRNS